MRARGGAGWSGQEGRELEASGLPLSSHGAYSGMADEVVRRRRARAVARTVRGRRPGRGSGRADLAGPRPREGMGALWAVRLADWACLAAKAQAESGWAVGRRGPRGGQGSPTPSSLPFFKTAFAFSFLFLLANKDFAKDYAIWTK